MDVAPTILEVAGVAVPSQMQGQSLLRIAKSGANAGGDHPAYLTEFPQRAFGWSALESWRAGKYLYIRAPKPELYDLAADPNAAHDLAQSSKATLQTMAAQLDASTGDSAARARPTGPSYLQVKCRSWRRSDTSGYRSQPPPPAPRPRALIPKMALLQPTKSGRGAPAGRRKS